MSVREAMRYRAAVKRQPTEAGVNEYGVAHTLRGDATYTVEAHTALPCTWTALDQPGDGEMKGGDVARALMTYRMLVPTGSDIRLTDRVTRVVDGQGVVYWSGLADVTQVEVRRGCLRVTAIQREPS